MRRAGRERPGGRHEPLWPGRDAPDAERHDAAGVRSSIQQDRLYRQQHPTISLSGPVDAPSTAGTQYVTATAGGSPSGIADIVVHASTVGRRRRTPARRAQVPVSGIGTHTVSCYAQDNAVDPAGAHGSSIDGDLVAEDR